MSAPQGIGEDFTKKLPFPVKGRSLGEQNTPSAPAALPGVVVPGSNPTRPPFPTSNGMAIHKAKSAGTPSAPMTPPKPSLTNPAPTTAPPFEGPLMPGQESPDRLLPSPKTTAPTPSNGKGFGAFIDEQLGGSGWRMSTRDSQAGFVAQDGAFRGQTKASAIAALRQRFLQMSPEERSKYDEQANIIGGVASAAPQASAPATAKPEDRIAERQHGDFVNLNSDRFGQNAAQQYAQNSPGMLDTGMNDDDYAHQMAERNGLDEEEDEE